MNANIRIAGDPSVTLQPIRLGTLLLHGAAVYRVSCCMARAEEVGLRRHPTGRRTWWVPVRRLSSGEFTLVSPPASSPKGTE